MDGRAQCWCTQFAGHSFKKKEFMTIACVICCNNYNSAKQEVDKICADSTRVLVLPLWVFFFFSVGNLPFQQCRKGFGQRSQDLLTQAHADMSTCSSPSWAYLILPISQGRR